MLRGEPIPILLVEDDDGQAMLVEESLRDGGIVNDFYRVSDGGEALDFLHRTGSYEGKAVPRPGLILLDVQLPKVNGDEVLRQVRSEDRLKDIPIIMLTMTSDQREIDLCYKLGVSAYIVKPVDFESFIEKIRKLGLFLEIMAYPSLG